MLIGVILTFLSQGCLRDSITHLSIIESTLSCLERAKHLRNLSSLLPRAMDSLVDDLAKLIPVTVPIEAGSDLPSGRTAEDQIMYNHDG